MNIRKDILFGDIRDKINMNDTQPSIPDMIAMLRIEVSELRKELKLGEQKVELLDLDQIDRHLVLCDKSEDYREGYCDGVIYAEREHDIRGKHE